MNERKRGSTCAPFAREPQFGEMSDRCIRGCHRYQQAEFCDRILTTEDRSSRVVRFADSNRLLRVSKASKSQIDQWKEGRSIEADTSRSIEELVERAIADRFVFARSMLSDADRLRRAKQFRSAVSRYYYAMYHAMRAAVFAAHGGDDHQEHRTLPGKVPSELSRAEILANALKDARERRNAADYDPYPKTRQAWAAVAAALSTSAHDMIAEIAIFLRNRTRYL